MMVYRDAWTDQFRKVCVWHDSESTRYEGRSALKRTWQEAIRYREEYTKNRIHKYGATSINTKMLH